jgi:hypothetical protein
MRAQASGQALAYRTHYLSDLIFETWLRPFRFASYNALSAAITSPLWSAISGLNADTPTLIVT